MIGKRFPSDDEVLARLRRLEHRVAAIQMGTGDTVKITEDGEETFIELADCPQTYAGSAGLIVAVNTTENELYFNSYVLVDETAPILALRNMTDAAIDPIIQFAVGATPVTKFTMGVDDSDNDTWKLSVGDILGDDHDTIIISSEGGAPGVDEFTTIATFGNVTAMYGVSTVGTYLYASLGYYDQLQKRNLSDGALVAESPVVDPNSLLLRQSTTDGTHVYVLSLVGCNVFKYLCSDLSYVGGSDYWSNSISGICYRAGYLYITAAYTYQVRKIRCSDMATTWTTSFTQGSGTNQMDRPEGVTTDGQFIYVADCGGANNRIIRLNMDGTWYDSTTAAYTLYTPYHTAMWCAGDYLYNAAEYAANDIYVEKRNKSDLSISASFDITPNFVVGGCQWGDYHYVVAYAAAGIYKKQYVTSSASAPAKIRFRLKGLYGQFIDIVALTADVRLGVGTMIPSETIEAVGNIKATAGQFISTMATGTAPLVVTSTTVCTNLNAGLVDGYHHDQSLLTTVGPSFDHLHLTVADGDAPVVVTSTTVCANLNAGLVDGYHHDQSLLTTVGPSFDHLHLTIADGTAPLVVASSTEIANLNAHLLQGNHASAFAVAGHSHAYEPALGNPASSGYVLSSTDVGVRSWIASGGSLALDDLTDVDAASPSDDDIIRFDTVSGTWMNEALPAGGGAGVLEIQVFGG